MCRGDGRIQRAIKTIFTENPNTRFSLPDLMNMLYPEGHTRSDYVAVSRAARGVAASMGWGYAQRKYFRKTFKTLDEIYKELNFTPKKKG